MRTARSEAPVFPVAWQLSTRQTGVLWTRLRAPVPAGRKPGCGTSTLRLAAEHHQEILMRHRRIGQLGLVLLFLVAGCRDRDLPTEPVRPGDVLHAISDGIHNGREGFYFLPPLVKDPAHTGTFDASLSPVVEICETPECAALHARFSMTEGTGSEIVRLDVQAEHYTVNWHTNRTGTVLGQTYRVRVSVAGTVLGYADIQMTANGAAARKTPNGEVIGVVHGRTLPVKFRIEAGAVLVVGSEGGSLVWNHGAVTLDVPPGAVDGVIGITVTPVSDDLDDPDVVPGLVFEFLPSPYTFDPPVTLTVVYDPARLPIGIPEDELRLLAVVGGRWVQIPGSSVDVATSTVSGPLGSFSRKAVGRGKVHAVAVSPAHASVAAGETQQFLAVVTDVDGEEMDRNVQWTSSDDAVATVDADGLASGVADGPATITASAGGVSETANLTVTAGDASGAFVTRWDTNLGDGTTVTLALGLALAGTMDATINWGDGTITRVTGPGPHVHDYGVNGIRTVSVTGTVPAYNGRDNGGSASERSKLVEVVAWGDVGFRSLHAAFFGAVNLTAVPPGSTGIENVTDMGHMFSGATSFNGDIGGWDTRDVFAMNSMFHGATSFNQDIGGWDTGSVIGMTSMFRGATTFNQDIGSWNTGRVTGMNFMFRDATAFNQDIGSWETGTVVNMTSMFEYAVAFNQNIGGWDTGNVTDMAHMFLQATSFNQDVGGWNTAKVTAMWSMFEGATSFNHDIGGWDTRTVSGMQWMFAGATLFNQDLSGWCVTSITSTPLGFDHTATSWVMPRPVWGTCPADGPGWQAMAGGVNGRVRALGIYEGDLIVGGDFTLAGGQPAARIARWNGTSWQPMNDDMDGSVSAITVYNGDLIIGGFFREIDGERIHNRIARWDGTRWQQIPGMNGNVSALIVYNGDLIAAGSFSSHGNNIARWDGSAWHSMGTGMNNPIHTLAVFGDDLIAGGSFTTAGGQATNYIARWNGSGWQAMGSGPNGSVRSLTAFEGALVAAIDITSGPGEVARWGGTSWEVLGGMSFGVASVVVHDGTLFAGGPFTFVGTPSTVGSSISHIAQFDGSDWSAVGDGMNAAVWTMLPYDGHLVAGGVFTTAGEAVVNHVARWYRP
jgi:surface protein